MRKNVKLYENKTFAERLRTIMGKRNVGLADIAAATGCAVSTASTWRRGRVPRDFGTIEDIARFLSVDAAYLTGELPDFPSVFSNSARPPRTRLGDEIERHVVALVEMSDEKLLRRLKTELEKNFPLAAKS